MADSALTTWVKNIAGAFGTELSLTDANYAVVIDWTLEALAIDAEPSPLDSACKTVARACLWQYVMGVVTGHQDTFDRAKILYEMACDAASVYLPDISGITKALIFYDPYVTVEDTDYV